jgi:hypothetical protein
MTMTSRRFSLCALTALAALTLLSGCNRSDDPQSSLDAAVRQLQDNQEAKKTGDVLDQLHPSFRAQQEFDRDWAKRTMTGLFLQHQQVKIVALSQSSIVDPKARDFGLTEAQVVLTGAQGLIPDQVSPYRVQLRWQRDGKTWKLLNLDWQ